MLVVITDKKVAIGTATNPIDYFMAEITTITDYYPFGMGMTERAYSAPQSGYRFGFNGMEMDDEMKGDGNSLDFGARIYDSRLGRWLSVDPIYKKYASLSPYIFSNLNPIAFRDFNGEDWKIATYEDDKGNKTVIITLTVAVIDNSSNTTIDMQEFQNQSIAQLGLLAGAESYKDQIIEANQAASGIDGYNPNPKVATKKDINVNVVFQINIREIKNETELKSDEHLISIEDDNDPKMSKRETAHVNKIGGKKIFVKASVAKRISEGKNVRTMAHELGHTLGLSHENKSPANVMSSMYNASSTNVTTKQLKLIENNINNGEVNKK